MIIPFIHIYVHFGAHFSFFFFFNDVFLKVVHQASDLRSSES